jgi:hypothetical protein
MELVDGVVDDRALAVAKAKEIRDPQRTFTALLPWPDQNALAP